MSLRFLAGGDAAVACVAYAVPKSAGNAVRRNRIRRRLRAAVGRSEALEPGGAYLFSAAAPAATIPFETLCESVNSLVRASRPASGARA